MSGTAVRGGVRPSAALPAGTTTRDLRHHEAGVLLAAAGSVVAVAERLGHENATLVLTTYGHLLPELRGAHPAGDRVGRCAPDVAQGPRTGPDLR
jgi:integrase